MPVKEKNPGVFELSNEKSSVEIYSVGATVTSWKVAGQENLFMSSKAILDGSKGIRGGIPIVFPWFGPSPGKPQHGFVRDSQWIHKSTSDANSAVFEFSPNENAKKYFAEYSFHLTYTVSISPTNGDLTTQLEVKNNSSDVAMPFQVLLHTYFRVQDINKVSVKGLQGKTYVDKTDDFMEKTESAPQIEVSSEVDRVYANTPDQVDLYENGKLKIVTKKAGFADTVVWNPWIETSKKMSDLSGYEEFICIEHGTVKGQVQLPAGETWKASQTFLVASSANL